VTEAEENKQAIRRALERIAALDVGPDEALITIRSLYGPRETDGLEALYEALRSAMWHLMASRTYGTEMNKWHNVLRQIAAWHSPNSLIYERVRVLADFALTSGHFGVLLDQARGSEPSEHVTKILTAVSMAGGKATLGQISRVTGITTNLLLVIINNMAAEGVLNKVGYGPGAIVSIP
jgi:hypothetical protein